MVGIGQLGTGQGWGGCHVRPGRSAGGEFERESEMEVGVEWGSWWTDVGFARSDTGIEYRYRLR